MSEDVPTTGAQDPAADAVGDAAAAGAADEESVRTGVPNVDEVIEAVEELEERPIEEHVGVFETAHEQLRRALDAQQPGGDQQSAS